MGMFDRFVTDGDPRFTCAHGHVVDDFQTKNLGCDLDRYRLVGDVLHVERFTYDDDGEPAHKDLDRCSITRTINVYTSCSECRAVMTKQSHGVVKHDVWVSLELEFYRGDLKSISRAADDQTREQLREELGGMGKKYGYSVLPDEK